VRETSRRVKKSKSANHLASDQNSKLGSQEKMESEVNWGKERTPRRPGLNVSREKQKETVDKHSIKVIRPGEKTSGRQKRGTTGQGNQEKNIR